MLWDSISTLVQHRKTCCGYHDLLLMFSDQLRMFYCTWTDDLFLHNRFNNMKINSKISRLILHRADSEKLQLVVLLYLFRYNVYFNFC